MLAAGTQLGPYKITAPLGAGGMGEVYRAADSRLGREVAVKVLAERFSANAELRGRFEREAQAVASLSHPNILAIHDYGTEGSSTYAVMELLEGQTLRARLDKGALPWRKAVEFGVAIAEGLAAAHAKGITHRDLKPENLFLTSGGSLKILDFGLAQIKAPVGGLDATSPPASSATEPGTVLGTVGYMAPEQVRGQPSDVRSDIFSLGCVLYEMATGQRAFARETAAETMTAILHEEPADIGSSGKHVPLEVERVIQHCLEKGRDERFQSARDLSFALKAILSDSNVSGVRTGGRGPGRPSAVVWIAIAGALLAIAAISAFLLVPALRPEAATNTSVKSGQAFDSLAILPLINVNEDAKSEPLCEGIAEHLSSRLSQVGQLKIRPITSTAHYRRQNADAKTIGRELNVQAVVTGRLRQEGELLVIAMEMVDASDNSLVWSQRYDGTRQQILDLQDKLARDLAGKLGLKLSDEEQRRVTKRHTENPEAYLLYGEGVYHMHKFTEEGLEIANEYYQRALTKDPNYALAYAGLGFSHSLLGSIHHGPRKFHPQAEAYLNKALEIDPAVPGAHSAIGAIRMFHHWDWPGAEREFKLASSFDPGLASYALYGFYLAAIGRPGDALSAIQEGTALDPLSPPRRNEVAMAYNWVRQYDQAISEARKSLELNPNFPLAYTQLAQALIQKGRYEQAIAELHKAPQFAKSPSILSLVGCAHALAGRRGEAQSVLEELKDPARLRYGSAIAIARVHAALGEKDDAFEWLDKACDERHVNVIWVKVDPTWDTLRSDDRFDALLQQMRLADKPTQARSASEGTLPSPIETLAVLPFVYQSGDADAEFLADGISQRLSTSLAQVRTLKVRPASAVTRFKDQAADDLFAVGKTLQVQAVVTGKVQKRGERLFVSWQLADVRTSSVVDGANYSRAMSDLFELQEELAKEIAGKLQLKLTGEDQRQLTKRPTKSLKAFELNTIGKQYFLQFNEQALRRAVDCFERAIQEDPNYAEAYAGLAGAYGVLGANHLSPKETVPKAKQAVAEALRLDDTLADAYVSQGAIKLLHDWDWPAALLALQRAEQLQPNHFAPPNLRAYYFIVMKRMDEALAEIKRAQALDPTAMVVSTDVGLTHYFARQYDQAISQLRETLKTDPSFVGAHANLGFAYLQKGAHAEALAALNTAVALSDRSPQMVAALAYGLAVAGQPVEAQRLLTELLASSSERYVSPYDIALVYTGLRDTEQAIAWLRKAYEEHSTWLIWLNVEPCFDNLRSDPRFNAILQNMGLPNQGTAQAEKPIDTLAVLPFDNQSADADAGYLSDDVTYSLTDSLARVRELKVRPYSSAARFRAGSTDSKTAGRELQVQAVLRGSIQQRGENVLIDVELVHVGEDRRMWGSRYQGKLAERLALQQRIIQEVPEQLRLSLTGRDKQSLAQLPTQSLRAHELYVQGRLEWNKRTVPGLEKSMDLYRRAIDQDPKFALAWASLAEAHFVFPINTDSPPRDSMLEAKAAATKALEIDDQLVEAHANLAAIAGAFEWDWPEAERRFQRALAINPNNAFARFRYGQHLTVLRRFDEAQVHSARARELDPTSLIIRAVTGRHFYYARQYDAAIEQYRRALNINPDFWVARLFLGHAYAQQGKHQEAVAELERARQLPGGNLEAWASLGHVLAVMGRAAEAQRVLDDFQKLAHDRYVPPYYLAVIHAGLGEKEQALAVLDQAYEERNSFITLINVEPMFDSLRDEPRFQKIIAEMKFPE